MLVEQYFAELEAAIARFGSLLATTILKDIRSPYIGHFRADISRPYPASPTTSTSLAQWTQQPRWISRPCLMKSSARCSGTRTIGACFLVCPFRRQPCSCVACSQ